MKKRNIDELKEILRSDFRFYAGRIAFLERNLMGLFGARTNFCVDYKTDYIFNIDDFLVHLDKIGYLDKIAGVEVEDGDLSIFRIFFYFKTKEELTEFYDRFSVRVSFEKNYFSFEFRYKKTQ